MNDLDLDLIRRFRDDVNEPDAQHVEDALESFLAKIDLPAATRRPRPARRIAAIVAAAAAIAIGAPIVLPVGGPGGADPAAAEALRRVAVVAERQTPAPAPADGYVYSKSKAAWRVHYDACSFPGKAVTPPMACPQLPPNDWVFSVLVSQTREIWISSDGSGRLVTTKEAPVFLGPRDRATWESAGSPPLDRAGTTDETVGPQGLSPNDVSGYSTDTETLYRQIRAKADGYGPSTDAEMLVLVGDALREVIVPPKLRAALFRVAAMIPGVELVGPVTDPAGRNGTAVARTSNDAGYRERVELIFDPETSAFLAERQVLLERVDWIDAPPGTVIGYAAYLDSGIVASTSERP